RRIEEETRGATASPEAGTLACGTARRPHRDGRRSVGVPFPEFTMKSPDDASCNAKLAPFVFETSNAIRHYHFEVCGFSSLSSARGWGLPRRLGWTAPEPSRYNRHQALNPTEESVTIPSPRARKSTHARRFTLSPAVRTDPPATHLGGPSAGNGAAQADRRGQRLCRELGTGGLSRRRERRQRGRTLRDHPARPGAPSRPGSSGAWTAGPEPVPASGQVHRRPRGPVGPGPSRRRTGKTPGR